ncbi:MAG: TonB family protein [Burkholderiales bacterium]|nr:TonB family protein [Burkholderiales bacterium]
MTGIAARLVLVVVVHALLFHVVLQANPELKKAIEPIVVSLIAPPQPLPQAPPPQSPPPPAAKQSRPQPAVQPRAPLVPETPLPNAITTETALPVDTPSTPSHKPAAAAADPSPPAKPVAVVVPPRFDAAYLNNPAPSYPAAARRRGEGGRVQLRVLVSAAGRALRVEVSASSGSAVLDDAAKHAVERWRFLPARRGDEVIDAWVIVPIVFSLEG